MSGEEFEDLECQILERVISRAVEALKDDGLGCGRQEASFPCAEVIQGCEGISWMLVGNLRMSNSEFRSRGDVESLDRCWINMPKRRQNIPRGEIAAFMVRVLNDASSWLSVVPSPHLRTEGAKKKKRFTMGSLSLRSMQWEQDSINACELSGGTCHGSPIAVITNSIFIGSI